MSEENNVTQTPEDTQANNNSTQAEDKNVLMIDLQKLIQQRMML